MEPKHFTTLPCILAIAILAGCSHAPVAQRLIASEEENQLESSRRNIAVCNRLVRAEGRIHRAPASEINYADINLFAEGSSYAATGSLNRIQGNYSWRTAEERPGLNRVEMRADAGVNAKETNDLLQLAEAGNDCFHTYRHEISYDKKARTLEFRYKEGRSPAFATKGILLVQCD